MILEYVKLAIITLQGAGPHQHLLIDSIPMTLLEAFSCTLDQVSQNQSLSEDSGSRGYEDRGKERV